MPDQVTNYKCPACGGPLHFDPESQKLKCDFCGSVFEPAETMNRYETRVEHGFPCVKNDRLK